MFRFKNTAIWTSELSQCVTQIGMLSRWKKVSPLDFQRYYNHFKFMCTYASSRAKKKRAFIEKLTSKCFCWFPAAILVHQSGTKIWRLYTKFYKAVWNVSANNSATVRHKDLRLGQIVYIIVFYNISLSWLLPLDGFEFIFLLRDSDDDL